MSNDPNPEIIFNMMNAYQQSGALKGAIELDIFTAIAEGNTGATTIAQRCKASERGTRILLDYLTVAGLLTKKAGTYALTLDTALFLDKRSPAYLGTATEFLLSPDFTKSFSDIAGVVRKGGTLMPGNGTVAVENPVWVDFARGMAPLMMPAAQAMPDIAGASSGAKWKVLDIAAGHGLFGIMMAAESERGDRRFGLAESAGGRRGQCSEVWRGQSLEETARRCDDRRLRHGIRSRPAHQLPSPLRHRNERIDHEEGLCFAETGRPSHDPGIRSERRSRFPTGPRDVLNDHAGQHQLR